MPYKDKDKQREYQRIWKNNKNATLSSNGLCVYCGKPSVEYRCAICQWWHNLWNKISNSDPQKRLATNTKHRQLEKRYISEGRCPRCGKPLDEDDKGTLCINCTISKRERIR